MKEETVKHTLEISPRKLGDEWKHWTGETEENNGDLETKKRVFLSLFSITVLLTDIFIFFIYYLISPRLEDIHPALNETVYIFTGTAISVLTFYLMSILLTILFKKPFAFFLKGKDLINFPLVSWTLILGHKLGFSKDRIKNSLIHVTNEIVKTLYFVVLPHEILIVVPRCLSKFMRKELEDLTEKYQVTFHTAGGGTQARQLLITENPKAIIAVACERDLFSGIQDVAGKIPVIGISNKRPEGPCKNTYIHLDEMEKAIQYFLYGMN
ncbi:DUF116 domain-containing protein [Microaerobacter geothermalis]|uniref:DUF116 domain-containing protein n=1 Tax=Microaerobacter geothermalis TaxID=674972 RepID=UPI001F3C0125|nr:DUF116 domain-containing protein [Microaerobacter geothermalis]MCF6093159.1 DUF116 domain-containing protein [Microaerobacter geothermalis]